MVNIALRLSSLTSPPGTEPCPRGKGQKGRPAGPLPEAVFLGSQPSPQLRRRGSRAASENADDLRSLGAGSVVPGPGRRRAGRRRARVPARVGAHPSDRAGGPACPPRGRLSPGQSCRLTPGPRKPGASREKCPAPVARAAGDRTLPGAAGGGAWRGGRRGCREAGPRRGSGLQAWQGCSKRGAGRPWPRSPCRTAHRPRATLQPIDTDTHAQKWQCTAV